MPASFISSIHALPDEVIGHVLTYTPRHDTAQILWDASQTDGLRLKYLRRYRVPNDAHKDEIFAHLAPSVCGATVYGDEDAPMCIIRTNISVGECVRFRVLIEKQQLKQQRTINTTHQTKGSIKTGSIKAGQH